MYLKLHFSSEKFVRMIYSLYLCTTRTRQASQRCSNVRVVFLYVHFIMAATIPFGKQYTDSHDLVKLLKSRGLSVEDDTKAQHYLEHIEYYCVIRTKRQFTVLKSVNCRFVVFCPPIQHLGKNYPRCFKLGTFRY